MPNFITEVGYYWGDIFLFRPDKLVKKEEFSNQTHFLSSSIEDNFSVDLLRFCLPDAFAKKRSRSLFAALKA
jgi:hypothetical protein